jgi:hypothetical protein
MALRHRSQRTTPPPFQANAHVTGLAVVGPCFRTNNIRMIAEISLYSEKTAGKV